MGNVGKKYWDFNRDIDFIGENDERMDDVSHHGKMTMEKGWKAGWFWMILFLGVFGKIDRD